MRPAILVLCLLTALTALPAQQSKPNEPVYKVGGDVKPFRVISSPSPNFANDASRGKFDGVVAVSAYVGADGKIHDAQVSKSIGDAKIDAKVLSAVKSWKFHPCTKENKPVNCAANFEVQVHLE